MVANIMQRAKTTPMSPIAIFGMSADPAHKGHLKVAEAVQEMGYSRVMWMVTPHNPAKPHSQTPFVHRMELTRLLVGRRTWLELSDAEAWMYLYGEDLRTHTMLEHLTRIYPGVPYTFVIGADNWLQFHTWGKYREILDFCGLLIVPRPGSRGLDNCPAALALAARKDSKTTGPVTQGTWRIAEGLPGGSASSTQIRRDLASGTLPTRWLNAEQIAYIQAHNLYNIA